MGVWFHKSLKGRGFAEIGRVVFLIEGILTCLWGYQGLCLELSYTEKSFLFLALFTMLTMNPCVRVLLAQTGLLLVLPIKKTDKVSICDTDNV